MNLLKYFTSRDEDLPASYVRKSEKFLKKIKLKKLVRKLNKENAPPGGWKPGDRVQARKRPSLTRSQA